MIPSQPVGQMHTASFAVPVLVLLLLLFTGQTAGAGWSYLPLYTDLSSDFVAFRPGSVADAFARE